MEEKEIIKKYIPIVKEIVLKWQTDDVLDEDLLQEGCLGLIIAYKKFDSKKDGEFTLFARNYIEKQIKIYIEKQTKTIIPIKKENPIELVEEKELKANINELLLRSNLSITEKDILVKIFGLYNTKRYSLEKIASLKNKTIIEIERILNTALKKIRNCRDQELREYFELEKIDKQANINPQERTIYSYFQYFSKEQIDAVIISLPLEEQLILYNKNSYDKDYLRIIRKMAELLITFYGFVIDSHRNIPPLRKNKNMI